MKNVMSINKMRSRESNPRPLEHESSRITTRPVLPPTTKFITFFLHNFRGIFFINDQPPFSLCLSINLQPRFGLHFWHSEHSKSQVSNVSVPRSYEDQISSDSSILKGLLGSDWVRCAHDLPVMWGNCWWRRREFGSRPGVCCKLHLLKVRK